MKYTYEVKKVGGENGQEIIYRVEDGAWIPKDEANSDYQAYVNKDKAEQSTPIVIDEAKTK
jgi:hypothetical protein